MSNASGGMDHIARWIVCPASDRWLRAVRCFAREMIPEEWSVAVIAAEPSAIRQQLLGQQKSVVLWDIGGSLKPTWDTITQTAIESPNILQIAAVTELTVGEQVVLSELGVVSMIRHPEDLPKLGKMVCRYLLR